MRESLDLITGELEEHGSKLDTAITKLEAIDKTMGRIERLLVDVLRGDEKRQRDFDQARKSDQEERRKLSDRVDRLTKLRPVNGAG